MREPDEADWAYVDSPLSRVVKNFSRIAGSWEFLPPGPRGIPCARFELHLIELLGELSQFRFRFGVPPPGTRHPIGRTWR